MKENNFFGELFVDFLKIALFWKNINEFEIIFIYC